MISEQEFRQLAEQGYNRIPVILETLADLDTPLSIYLKLANTPYSYLLESVQGGERFGRYSFIGLSAKTRIQVIGNEVSEIEGGNILEQREDVNPLEAIRNYLKQFKVASLPNLPRLCGGLVGYFGYDTVRYIESRLKSSKTDLLQIPDILLLLSEELAVIDNLKGKLYLIIYADPSKKDAYHQACQRLATLLAILRQPVSIPEEGPLPATNFNLGAGKDYLNAVIKAKHYIYEGDIMQVVLSHRFEQSYSGTPLALYRALRTLNPSPYMFYFNFQDFHVVGASPEILVRLEKGTVTVRPIAGTRPRGKTVEEDSRFAEDLLADPKERAEHVMLMDLGRNDVGRVAQIGSVKVTESMIIERYSHVMHIVSNVEGKLKPEHDAISVLQATFPAGTVSGAPKVRAMEIIDELEPTKRGIYAGAVGYINFNQDMDLAIAIRTALVKNKKMYVQAGAGIVADSVPENEWKEVMNKARATLRAAEMVQKGLDTQISNNQQKFS